MDIHMHWAVFLDNRSDKSGFIQCLLEGPLPEPMEYLHGKKAALFSRKALEYFMEEEIRHDNKLLTGDTTQSLQSMSSGERKKALLRYLLRQKPDYLILDNPFDNLDRDSQESLRIMLAELQHEIVLIQLISRSKDLLPFIRKLAYLKSGSLIPYSSLDELLEQNRVRQPFSGAAIPPALEASPEPPDPLVELHKVSVSYSGKPILDRIDWKIRPGEFWQLAGPNGSGKTTLLSMITGDNPKGYGQEMFLFGKRKGSGESVWDIKRQLGYFTPAMIDRFRGYHSLENMLISGLTDSIGLYVRPTEAQQRIARAWLGILGLEDRSSTYFHDLSTGWQRLLMCARAMIKHPPLLILDEPTAGLDDASASLFVSLVNKISRESKTAIIFVSHREEPGLKPDALFQLELQEHGSRGFMQRLSD